MAVGHAYGARLVALVKMGVPSDSQHRTGGISSEYYVKRFSRDPTMALASRGRTSLVLLDRSSFWVSTVKTVF